MILGIDPGTKQSGFALFADGRVHESGVQPNQELLERVATVGAYVRAEMHQPLILAIERFEARGMPIGDDSIETIIWTGRFAQAWYRPEDVVFVRRGAIKVELCGTAKAKDANIRQALIDRLGPQGTKAAHGPTYGVASHAWAALAVAVVAQGRYTSLLMQ